MLSFLLWFIVAMVVLAIVIILVRWILSLTGLAIPQPLLIVLGLILFLIVLLALFSYVPLGGVHTPFFSR